MSNVKMKILLVHLMLTVLALSFAFVTPVNDVAADIALVHNDITNGQYCHVCKVGSDRTCITIQSGEIAGVDTYHLTKGGYFVSCPIGLTRATDVERTVLEGLLRIHVEPGETIGLKAHTNSISKLNILHERASPTEVLRAVNSKVAASISAEDP